MFIFKNKTASTASETIFWFVGIHLPSNANKLEAALIGTENRRPGSAILLKKSLSFDLPTEISEAFADLRREMRAEEESDFNRRQASGVDFNANFVSSGTKPSSSNLERAVDSSVLTKLATLRSMAATIQEEAINELLADASVRREELVAVALNDPGIWAPTSAWNDCSTNFGLGSGALLAERTGLNVVDSFLVKDSTDCGQGSPIFALPYWILLGGGERDRLLIDLGATARWAYLPSATADKRSWTRIRFGEISPCGSLLDALTEQATKGEARIDVGGKLSVQGRRLPALLDFWRERVREVSGKDALPPRYFSSPTSKTLNETFYLEQIQSAANQKWSSLDALCEAAHWIAESVAATVEDVAAQVSTPFDVVLTGAAKQNCLLVNRLATLLAPRATCSLADCGFAEDSFDAVAVATLGVLFAAGIPAALPELTGASRESLLGRASPGTPKNWERFWRFRIM